MPLFRVTPPTRLEVVVVFVIAPPVTAILRSLIVLVAGPVNPPVVDTRAVSGSIPTRLIVFSAGPVNPVVEAIKPVAAIVVTPVSAPEFRVTPLIVLDVVALIPPDVVSVVPLNVNVPAVAPFIVD